VAGADVAAHPARGRRALSRPGHGERERKTSGTTAGLRRNLLRVLYALLPIGAVIGFGVDTMAGTVIVVVAVIGLVMLSLTA
jgi:Flp pilus assembly protein TadB